MSKPSGGSTVVVFRLPRDVLAQVDAIVAAEGTRGLMRTRSDVLRAAIVKWLETRAEGGAR